MRCMFSSDIIKRLLKGRPEQAYRIDANFGHAPLGSAVTSGNVEIVKIFLEHDHNLAYIGSKETNNMGHPFLVAACCGLVSVAKEIIRACPDSAYASTSDMGNNALHVAIYNDKPCFVDYILRTPQLHRLINQADFQGHLPLHGAAGCCNPMLLRSLLNYKRQDYTDVNAWNRNVVDITTSQTNLTKTLKWVWFSYCS
jgi:ankyrin repeat protein